MKESRSTNRKRLEDIEQGETFPQDPVSVARESQYVAPKTTAEDDLRLSYSYLQDWIDQNEPDSALGHAARYIESARAKDPGATISVVEKIDGEKVSNAYDCDSLAGLCLFYTAQSQYDPNDRESLERASATLKKALEYSPASVQYREWLADAYLDLHDREKALAVAREAVEKNPKAISARKLLDRIEAAPVTHPPASVSTSTVVRIIGAVLALIAVISLFQGYFSNFFTFAVFAAIALVIAHFLEGSEIFQKAVEAAEIERAKGRKRRR